MANPTRYDLREMTRIESEIHEPREGEENRLNAFSDVFDPAARNSSITVLMKSIKTNKGFVDYTIDNNYDYLVRSFMIQELPKVKVLTEHESKIQIRWTDYLGINIFKTGLFKNDDTIVNTLTPIGLYNYMMTLMDHRVFSEFVKKIGHRDSLITWTNELSEDIIGIQLPWFYSIHPSRALPLFLIKDKDKLVHRFEFQPIDKLLRMRQFDGKLNEWRDIPFNSAYIQYNTYNDKYLPTAEMYAKMTDIDDGEKIDMECEMKENNNTYFRFIDDFVVVQSSEEFSEGQSGTVHLNSDAPCKSLSFCAINSQYYKHNNYCNFTDSKNPLDGDSPISSYSLYYDDVARIPDTSIFMNEMDRFSTLPYNADIKGFASHCFDLKPDFMTACSGPVFKGINSVFKVQFKEPKDEEHTQRYVLVVIMWITKKLILTVDNDSKLFNLSIEPKVTFDERNYTDPLLKK